jgi:hypothetical protein
MAPALTPPLDPGRIEAEIARIRERESGAWSAGTKATLFNLIVARAAPKPDSSADHVEEALGFLLGKRPARIISISTGATGPVEAVVSARCHPDQRGRGVCFEEVHIAGSLGADPGVWVPLLIRDIPTFLWWTAPFAAVTAAAEHADKLIVDCGPQGPEALAALAGLAELRERARRALAVGDLSWGRSRVLRVQAARMFDPPEGRELLGDIAGVELTGGTAAEALLFFLWLGERLRWLPAGLETTGMPRFREPKDRWQLLLAHREAGPLAIGARLRFVFRGGAPLELTCSRGGCLLRGAERGAWRIPGDGELLLAEVDSLEQDPLLAATLESAACVRSAGERLPGEPPS